MWMCWVRSCFEGEKEKQREIIVEKVSQCLVQGEILEGDDYRMIEQGERTERKGEHVRECIFEKQKTFDWMSFRGAYRLWR